MAVTIYSSATEYLRNDITELVGGSVADIVSVGVYHASNANTVPAVAEFDAATLVDGVSDPDNPLAEDGKVTIISLIGPRGGIELSSGVYQRYVLISTADEDIIRRPDTITVS